MVNDYKRNVIDYFKKNLLKGYTAETLKWALINQGYSRSIVERALEIAQKELAEKAPLLKEKPVIKYEIIDEHDNPIKIRKPWLKRFFGFFKNL
jgi:SOS response regulatory protein OraA/RecX